MATPRLSSVSIGFVNVGSCRFSSAVRVVVVVVVGASGTRVLSARFSAQKKVSRRQREQTQRATARERRQRAVERLCKAIGVSADDENENDNHKSRRSRPS